MVKDEDDYLFSLERKVKVFNSLYLPLANKALQILAKDEEGQKILKQYEMDNEIKQLHIQETTTMIEEIKFNMEEIKKSVNNLIHAAGEEEIVNKRWLDIARTDLQIGFMALRRALENPDDSF